MHQVTYVYVPIVLNYRTGRVLNDDLKEDGQALGFEFEIKEAVNIVSKIPRNEFSGGEGVEIWIRITVWKD